MAMRLPTPGDADQAASSMPPLFLWWPTTAAFPAYPPQMPPPQSPGCGAAKCSSDPIASLREIYCPLAGLQSPSLPPAGTVDVAAATPTSGAGVVPCDDAAAMCRALREAVELVSTLVRVDRTVVAPVATGAGAAAAAAGASSTLASSQ